VADKFRPRHNSKTIDRKVLLSIGNDKWYGLELKCQRSRLRLGLGLTAIRRGFELYECLLVVEAIVLAVDSGSRLLVHSLSEHASDDIRDIWLDSEQGHRRPTHLNTCLPCRGAYKRAICLQITT